MSHNKKPILRTRIKTINSEHLTKTQLALQAIKNFQARNSKASHRNLVNLQSPNEIINDLDTDYSRLHFHKELSIDRILRLQIFPYNQQYFSIDISSMLFPIRVFVKNVKNQGTLYVGYNRKFPGVNIVESARSKTEDSEKNYDYKFNFNKDIMFVLKNDSRKYVETIYLNFSAHSELLMFHLKFDCIGYEGMQNQKVKKRRIMTEQKIDLQSTKKDFFLPPTNPSQRENERYSKEQIFQSLKRSNTDVASLVKAQVTTSGFSPDKIKSNTMGKFLLNPSAKNFSQLNLVNLKNFKRDRSKEIKAQKKEKFNETFVKVKVNKEQFELYKQKDREIRHTSAKIKKLIEAYEKNYKANLVKNRKIMHFLVPFFFANIFTKKSNLLYHGESKRLESGFVIRYFIQKFLRKMSKQHNQEKKMMPWFRQRNTTSVSHLFTLGSKMIHSEESRRATQILIDVFNNVKPGILLNIALNRGSNYRRSVRTIQRRWLTKYEARVLMLYIFIEAHIEMMLKDFPHLKLGLKTFKQKKVRQMIAYEYMVDESMKFRLIKAAHKHRQQEIADFKQENLKSKDYNKKNPDKKQKKLLQIPHSAPNPQQRIFRNLDILKSMVRGWFEIEYKKILKRNQMP